MRATSSLALALALALVVGVAHAEGQRDVATLFEEGMSAYRRGDFRAAALAFEEANRRAPHGDTLYDAALAWTQAKVHERAAEDFAAALADPQLDAQHAADARRRLAEAESKVGRLQVTGPADARLRVDAREESSLPANMYLAPGSHTVQVRFARGEPESRTVELTAGATLVSAFEAPPAPAVAKPEPAPWVRKTPAPSPPPRSKVLPALGFTGLGLGVAAGLTSAILGGQALAAKNDFDDSGFTDAGARDRAATFRTATNATWIAGAVVGVAGVACLVAWRALGPHE